jgi:hypothetical protein
MSASKSMSSAATERRHQALALLKQGLSLTKIGVVLGGISRQRVHQLLNPHQNLKRDARYRERKRGGPPMTSAEAWKIAIATRWSKRASHILK